MARHASRREIITAPPLSIDELQPQPTKTVATAAHLQKPESIRRTGSRDHASRKSRPLPRPRLSRVPFQLEPRKHLLRCFLELLELEVECRGSWAASRHLQRARQSITILGKVEFLQKPRSPGSTVCDIQLWRSHQGHCRRSRFDPTREGPQGRRDGNGSLDFSFPGPWGWARSDTYTPCGGMLVLAPPAPRPLPLPLLTSSCFEHPQSLPLISEQASRQAPGLSAVATSSASSR